MGGLFRYFQGSTAEIFEYSSPVVGSWTSLTDPLEWFIDAGRCETPSSFDGPRDLKIKDPKRCCKPGTSECKSFA